MKNNTMTGTKFLAILRRINYLGIVNCQMRAEKFNKLVVAEVAVKHGVGFEDSRGGH